jgi:hypothetical protein
MRWNGNIKMDLKETGRDDTERIQCSGCLLWREFLKMREIS